jgi:hypothetical protein
MLFTKPGKYGCLKTIRPWVWRRGNESHQRLKLSESVSTPIGQESEQLCSRRIGGGRPEDEVTVKPYDPFGFQHHLIRRKEAHYKGDHVPEEESYCEEIATDLVHAEAIILIGHATSKSSAVNFLSEHLKTHHPETFKRIIATETADLSALTEPEIEEIAKKHLRAAAFIPA